MKFLLFVVLTFSLLIGAHEKAFINKFSDLNLKQINYIALDLSKSDFFIKDTSFIANKTISSLKTKIFIEEGNSLKDHFYRRLPDGHYAAVYMNDQGKEIYWQSLGDPFMLSASHKHGPGEQIYYDRENSSIVLKLSKDIPSAQIKIGYRDDNQISFYSNIINIHR